MKILVADDDAVSRRMMKHVLERSGYEVVVAENGREAVEALAGSDGPRLALIDWMMVNEGRWRCPSIKDMLDSTAPKEV